MTSKSQASVHPQRLLSATVHRLSIICVVILLTGLLHCSLFGGAEQSRTRRPVQGIVKEFPDRTTYYVIYSLPDFFPGDIPVYSQGDVQRIYVYGERDMDIIITTTDPLDKIVTHYRESGNRNEWRIVRSEADDAAENRDFELPLQFNNKMVDILGLKAEHGQIIALSRRSVAIVCRVVKIADSPIVYIIQHIRTVH